MIERNVFGFLVMLVAPIAVPVPEITKDNCSCNRMKISVLYSAFKTGFKFSSEISTPFTRYSTVTPNLKRVSCFFSCDKVIQFLIK